MFRGKSWFSGGVTKPKNPHSLDHLKFLYQILSKNHIVTVQNKGLLVETLRSIAEILIWGDQNDSTVFDFFLEKNMLSFFLKIMRQKCGSYVCVQLLQTLNILFENIRNETSLYYLLSNNHVNSIIVHKFDFSDEEVMAYYISFLKTLSLKLNNHTIHFFYSEHTNDFPLYTEAIKFFNHSESMVRIAVRTLTLNVFRVDDKAMLKFIRDRTAAPYFSNLVWFIGKHVLELDSCAQQTEINPTKLADLVAEHLDHLHYLNDILCLKIDTLNQVLTDHLLNRLLIPLYVYSFIQHRHEEVVKRHHVSIVVALFLISQVFLIVSHKPLVRHLAHLLINQDESIFKSPESGNSANGDSKEPSFVPPEESLEKSLESHARVNNISRENSSLGEDEEPRVESSSESISDAAKETIKELDDPSSQTNCDIEGMNITDEEKAVAYQRLTQVRIDHLNQSFSLLERPFLEAIFEALDCTENDHTALFSLSLLYALGHNTGINQDLLESVLIPTDKSKTKIWYNVNLVERLLKIINHSCQYNSKVRLATLQMSLVVLEQMVLQTGQSFLQDAHLAALEQAREDSTLLLRSFYKSEEVFLDMFEDEYQEIKKKPLNVEYLTMDASLLLPPSGTPMSGVEFHKRLPCGEVERAKRTIRVFFLLRDLSLKLQNQPETQLPLTNPSECIKVDQALDLNNSDLISCTIMTKEGQKFRRFMVIDKLQLVLVEPDTKRMGWGIAKFVGFLQDIEVTGDKDDSRLLHITVLKPNRRTHLLSAKFQFDDHIRCMAAKQRLTKGRLKARQTKMHRIARILELPDHIQPCPSPMRQHITPRPTNDSGMLPRSLSQDTGLKGRVHRPVLMNPANKVPGFATKLKPSSHDGEMGSGSGGRKRSTSRSRDSSPRQRADSEEIPLEDLSSKARASRPTGQIYLRRKSSSGLPQARISAPPGFHYSITPPRTCTIHTEENLTTSPPKTLSQAIPKCLTEELESPPSSVCTKPCCNTDTSSSSSQKEDQQSHKERHQSGTIQTV